MTEELLEKLVEFSQKYLPYEDRDLIKNYFKTHSGYGTIDFAVDDKQEIIGLVRYNISPDGETGEILDLVIRPDWRYQGLGNNFIRKALKTFTKAKFLAFRRDRKTRKEERRLLISEVLKHNFF